MTFEQGQKGFRIQLLDTEAFLFTHRHERYSIANCRQLRAFPLDLFAPGPLSSPLVRLCGRQSSTIEPEAESIRVSSGVPGFLWVGSHDLSQDSNLWSLLFSGSILLHLAEPFCRL